MLMNPIEKLMNPIEMLMNLTKLEVVTMTTSETLSWSKKLELGSSGSKLKVQARSSIENLHSVPPFTRIVLNQNLQIAWRTVPFHAKTWTSLCARIRNVININSPYERSFES